MERTEQINGELKKGDAALIIRENGIIELAFPGYEEAEVVSQAVFYVCALARALVEGEEGLEPLLNKMAKVLDAIG
jgi:hypothetical protein